VCKCLFVCVCIHGVIYVCVCALGGEPEQENCCPENCDIRTRTRICMPLLVSRKASLSACSLDGNDLGHQMMLMGRLQRKSEKDSAKI
jgi:hypothetical protein